MNPHQHMAAALVEYLEQRHEAAIERTRIGQLMAASVRFFDYPLDTPHKRRLAAAHLRKAA